MLRLSLVVLLTSLLGSGGVAAGLVTDVPSIVQFVFVGCLGLFVVLLATGALKRGGVRSRDRGPDSPASIVAPSAERHDHQGPQRAPLVESAAD
jgi:hypothetical protein